MNALLMVGLLLVAVVGGWWWVNWLGNRRVEQFREIRRQLRVLEQVIPMLQSREVLDARRGLVLLIDQQCAGLSSKALHSLLVVNCVCVTEWLETGWVEYADFKLACELLEKHANDRIYCHDLCWAIIRELLQRRIALLSALV